ncbi:MAG: hypothetical protein LBC52_06490 [Treponema sp.]|jgi:hypothetical protein|nr:hypothetical protein [Treponema sp.]
MKIKVFIIPISLIMGISIFSCIFPEDETTSVTQKSYFLGEDSFSIDGKIYTLRGQPLSGGNNITTRIYINPAWKITSPVNGNSFKIQISKTSDDGIVLSKGLSTNHTMYDSFLKYFTHYNIPHDGPEGKIQIYSLAFWLDDDKELIESESSKPMMFDEHFSFVYVTEPVNITGSWKEIDSFGDTTYWSYDCNFSKAGWYKTATFFSHAIGSNSAYPAYSSSSNIKLRTMDW